MLSITSNLNLGIIFYHLKSRLMTFEKVKRFRIEVENIYNALFLGTEYTHKKLFFKKFTKKIGLKSIIFSMRKYIHCTKNEEILNGKLHFLCSDFSRSSDAERANKPHRCPRKREKTKQRVRQHWTKFVWRDYVNWNWSYVQVLMVWIFLQLLFTETSTVQTGGLHDSLIVKRLETAVHARCTALIFSPAR